MIMGQPRSTSVLTPYHKSVFPPRGPHGIPNQSLSHSAGPFTDVVTTNLKLGNPTVEGATVSATSLGNGRAKKVIVYRYKSKKTYHKKNGHRQAYTEVRIDKINA